MSATYRYLLLLGLLSGCASQLPPSRPPLPAPASTPATPPLALPPAKPEQIPQQFGGYYQDDGPILAVPYDLDQLPEPKVQAEALHRYANRPYRALGRNYTPRKTYGDFSQEGSASWYGKKFHGKRTASGEPYDMFLLSAAHPILPIPSYARVTNLANGKSVVVRVNDRGPFHKGRVIDLSYAAAYRLGYHNRGNAQVKVEALQPGDEREAPSAEQALLSAVEAEAGQLPAGSVLANRTDQLLSQPSPEVIEQNPNQRWVQLGAFASQTAAEGFRAKVMDALRWLDKAPQLESGGGVWRVRLGPFPSRAEAQALADRIANSADLRPVVVR